MITKERVKELAHQIGFDACGIATPELPPQAEETLHQWTREGKHGEMAYLEQYAERSDQFQNRFPQAKSVIVLGINYFSKSIKNQNGYLTGRETVVVDGRVARYAWGRDYHKVIREKIDLLKEKIKIESTIPVLFEESVDTKPMLERTFAERAGLGFRGKQTQLLSLQFGPWLFLAELLTDLALEADEPFSGSCGTCRLCIDECPTEAIEETGHIDARKCVAYLTIEHKTAIPAELRPKIGNWVFGCDECLDVCPYTAKEKETSWNDLTETAGFGPRLNLEELFQIKSNREYREKFGPSAISRANRKQLMRNTCVVLGNSGRKEALPFLKQAMRDTSGLVREHAAWALERIQGKI